MHYLGSGVDRGATLQKVADHVDLAKMTGCMEWSVASLKHKARVNMYHNARVNTSHTQYITPYSNNASLFI